LPNSCNRPQPPEKTPSFEKSAHQRVSKPTARRRGDLVPSCRSLPQVPSLRYHFPSICGVTTKFGNFTPSILDKVPRPIVEIMPIRYLVPGGQDWADQVPRPKSRLGPPPTSEATFCNVAVCHRSQKTWGKTHRKNRPGMLKSKKRNDLSD